MKALEIDYTMTLEFSSPVINHFFVLRCMPVSRGCQTVTARQLSVEPMVKLKTGSDVFGNISYRGQLNEAHTKFGFKATATVQVNSRDGSREPCIPQYKYATELTSVDENMENFLKSVFAGTSLEKPLGEKKIEAANVLEFAEKLSSALHEYMEYKPGSTNVKTTARQAFSQRQGVCQDFAHIFCALSRCAGIPARYVCGASLGEGSTHAWVEVFVPDQSYSGRKTLEIPGRWFGFDPTRNKRCNDDYVILAVGRDYNDCQVDRGIFRGNADQTQTVFVKTKAVEVADYVAPADMKIKKNFYAPPKSHEQ